MRPTRSRPHQYRAFTLLEVSLVVGILVVLSAMVVPTFIRQLKEDELPRSARQLRSMITLVRANAAFDNLRYQIRFPNEDELDPLGGERQPLIEREDDPIDDPEVFNLVTAPWAVGNTLLGDVWCAEVRLGRPTIEEIRTRRERAAENIEEELEELFEDIDPERPPLFVEPDGSSEWVTFVLTTAPRDIELEELEDYPQVDLIVDGATGLAWLQRPFYEEELDLFEEKNWPAVLRQDFLDPRVLTEDDVLEIRESQLRGAEVQVQGRELEVEP
ncbi:MAG: type II secretion system protein [Phycisphaerae bacterium]